MKLQSSGEFEGCSPSKDLSNEPVIKRFLLLLEPIRKEIKYVYLFGSRSRDDWRYHSRQALLLSEGEKAETHKGVVTLFGILFVKTGKFKKNLGKYLANLKDDMESGDYEVLSYIDKETARVP